MIVVHHLNDSRSQRILWLLEELSVPYEVHRYERDSATRRAPVDLAQVHPLGKSPVITDGTQTIAESGLIIEYLCDRHGSGTLAPVKSAGTDSPERLRWLYWLHHAEGSAMPVLLIKLLLARRQESASDSVVAALETGFLAPQIKLLTDFWESQLTATGWFAGAQFSAADVMMSFCVEACARFGLLADHPNLLRFLRRISARSPYQRAIERGGPYSFQPKFPRE